MIGQTFLHYRIVEKLGEGGMGAVYKAVDTHLDRPVAVKVLPPDKVADPERRSRFVQEAKAASALRHPNIVVIHDIASDRGRDFLVMEFVDGRPLDQIIGRKGLKLGEALGYAVQIADGLARAHAAGIVHRDLKPSNVMVTAEGLVKVLDFGLAKLTEDLPAAGAGPTMTMGLDDRPRTEAGYIVGTAAYMSPEQAEGKKVDARSDIFSFGSVLYEMLTGQRAFGRDSQMKTLAAVLNEEPRPAAAVNDAVPAELERVLARCLRKDPQRRWQTMSDLKVALQDLKEDSESGKLQAASAPARRGKSRALIPAAASALFILAAAAFLKFVALKPAGPAAYEIIPLTFDSGMTGFPALSPDGNIMAYSSDRQGSGNFDLWVQQTSGGKPRRLTDHPADDWFPSFSPDGSQVVFRSERDGGGIFVVDAVGGEEPRRIVDRGHVPKCSPDGRHLAFIVMPPTLDALQFRMYLVPSRGGEPRPFHHDLIPQMIGQGGSMVWSPDGKRILFRGRRADDPASADWWVAPVDGGGAVRTHAVENLRIGPAAIVHYPVGWSGNDVFFVAGTTIEGINLSRARIDPDDWTIKGPAEAITTGPGMKSYPAVMPDGRVFFTNMTAEIGIWSVPARADEAVLIGGAGKLSQDLMQKFSPSISRDGSKAAFVAFGGSQANRIEVRMKDLRTGLETSIPMQGITLGGAVLSPDGSRLAYRDIVGGRSRTFILSPGESVGREICAECALFDIFPGNGSAVVRAGPGSLAKMDLASGATAPLLARGGSILYARLSPDGRWLVWLGGGTDGRVSMRISPLEGPPDDARADVPIAEADYYLGSPDWSPNGRWLFYLSEKSGRTSIRAQELDPGTKRPFGPEREIYLPADSRAMLNFPKGNAAMDVAADRIVFAVTESQGNIALAKPQKR
jgi:serine/threonine protein kinase